MTKKTNSSAFLKDLRVKLSKLIKEKHMENIDVSVMVKLLTVQEAISEGPNKLMFKVVGKNEK